MCHLQIFCGSEYRMLYMYFTLAGLFMYELCIVNVPLPECIIKCGVCYKHSLSLVTVPSGITVNSN